MIHAAFKLKEVLMGDYLNGSVAGLAIVSPWWLPSLDTVSSKAALLLPIAGLIWLAVQIWAKIFRNK